MPVNPTEERIYAAVAGLSGPDQARAVAVFSRMFDENARGTLGLLAMIVAGHVRIDGLDTNGRLMLKLTEAGQTAAAEMMDTSPEFRAAFSMLTGKAMVAPPKGKPS